jgi:hypothetical protein
MPGIELGSWWHTSAAGLLSVQVACPRIESSYPYAASTYRRRNSSLAAVSGWRMCGDPEPSADPDARRVWGHASLVRVLSAPHAEWAVAGLAFVLSLPAIAIGLAADDYDLALAVTRDPWSAYAFQDRDPAQRLAHLLAARESGLLPWWIDLQFQQAFFRPLASLSLALDFTLWPSAAWLMHVENGLLFAAIVLLAASLYRALALPAPVRGLATFFFAMHGGQSMTTGWISGRSTLLATAFGFLSLRLFVAARRTPHVGLELAALLTFAAALASAEAGLATLAYVGVFALFAFGQASWPLIVRSVAGFAVVLAVWIAWYRAGGYGVKGSGFYLDPVGDPGQYAIGLFTAVPIYLASQLTVPFAASSVTAPLALPIVTALSLLILLGTRGLWLPLMRSDQRARMLGLGALLAVIPLGASVPQDRLVSFIAFGVCGLVALIVQERLAPGAPEQRRPTSGAVRLFRMHAMWAPLLYVPLLFGSMSMVAGGGVAALDQAVGPGDFRPVLLINAASELPVHFFGAMRRWRKQPSPTIDLLYGGGADVELRRTAERSLELTVARGFFACAVERIARDPGRRPLRAGEVIELSRMRARILAVRDGAPTRVGFDFTTSLDGRRILAWSGRELRRVVLPPIGGELHVPAATAL